MTLAAAASLAVSTLVTPAPAEARGGAVAAGVLGGLAAGAIIGGAAARPYGYYGGPYYAAAPYDRGWRQESGSGTVSAGACTGFGLATDRI